MDIGPGDKGVPDDIGHLVPELLEGRDGRRIRFLDGIQHAWPSVAREIQGKHPRKTAVEVPASHFPSTQDEMEVIAHQGIGQYLHAA